jgi:hypothetical protein
VKHRLVGFTREQILESGIRVRLDRLPERHRREQRAHCALHLSNLGGLQLVNQVSRLRRLVLRERNAVEEPLEDRVGLLRRAFAESGGPCHHGSRYLTPRQRLGDSGGIRHFLERRGTLGIACGIGRVA